MAMHVTPSIILTLTALIVTTLQGGMSPNGILVAANLKVTPLWNTNANDTHPCIISDENLNGTVIFHGSSHQTCSLQVTTLSASDAHLQVLTGSIPDESFFFYVERKENVDCQNRYVAVKEPDEPCGITFAQNNLQLNLQGNVSLHISKIPANEAVPLCLEAHQSPALGPNVSQTVNCLNVQGYKDKITCPDFRNIPGICTIDFQSNCNATLGNREVNFHCLDNSNFQNQEVLVIYPSNMIALNLSYNRIDAIGVKSFNGLHSLQRLHLLHNHLAELPEEIFWGLDNLMLLDISNNELKKLDGSLFQGLAGLMFLFLNHNKFTTLPIQVFQGLENLIQLFLFGNQINTLKPGLFAGLNNLKVLLLYANRLVSLDSGLFTGLTNLGILVLSRNELNTLGNGIFQDLINLHTLYLPSNQFSELDFNIFHNMPILSTIDLSSNKLQEIPNIKNLTHLSFLDLQDNPLLRISDDTLSSLSMNSIVYVSQHEICECYVPANTSCSAAFNRSPYLSCDRLLSDKVLATIMWIIGLNALGGNLFVMTWRRKVSRRSKIQDFLMSNLAMSDLLMGIYMIMIASADVYFGEYFPMRSEAWRTGITCRIAGALSILSSEASVFFVTVISIDRLISIKYPHVSKKLRSKLIYITVALTWLLSSALGIIPSALSGINFKFYDNSHVCIGLPLALTQLYSSVHVPKKVCGDGVRSCYSIDLLVTETGPLVSGMYFSSVMFLGLNCFCYLVILACYVEVVRVVYKSSKRVGLNKEMKEQMRLTAKVAAIVATDFACWFPIILLGILVQARVLTLPPSVYAWSVTFVLPINSAINPYLYTIAAIISDRRKRKVGDVSTTHSGTQQEGSLRSQGTQLQALSITQSQPNASTA